MTKRQTTSTQSKKRIDEKNHLIAAELDRFAAGWLLDGEYRAISPRTLENRRGILSRLKWWIDAHNVTRLDKLSMREYFAYCNNATGARWGNGGQGHVRDITTKPIRCTTVHTYYVYLQSFFNWCVAEGLIEVSPLDGIAKPDMRSKMQVRPFSPEQVQALMTAAAASRYAERDLAIVLFLLDTGVRVSECSGLLIGDVDKTAKTASVIGKGKKVRLVRFGKTTSMQLWRYLRTRPVDGADETAPLFTSVGGNRSRQSISFEGIEQMLARLGKVANIKGVRCSPHTFRHTFAVSFLRNGGNSFALQQLLGHTDVKMTLKYVSMASSDLAAQHVLASPVDNLTRRKS